MTETLQNASDDNDQNYIFYYMQLPSIISIIGVSCVCLTFYSFPELRRLRYCELVFYVSLNDLIASLGSSLGSVASGTTACNFQAVATNFNFLVSAFFTAVIAYQIYLVVVYSEVLNQEKMHQLHVLCWGVPLFVTLIPLTTSTYANPGNFRVEFVGRKGKSVSINVPAFFECEMTHIYFSFKVTN